MYMPTKRGFVVGVALWCTLIGAGCGSATRDISRAATQAAASAQSADNHFTAIGVAAAEAETMTPDDSPVAPLIDTIKEHAAAGLVDTENIKAASTKVHEAIPGVKDVTPWWASLIARIVGALILLGLIFLAYTSGVFPIIRAFFAGLGWFIPRPTAIRAKFDAENIESGDASQARKEVVAAARGSDPVYDKVFKREQAKLRQAKGAK